MGHGIGLMQVFELDLDWVDAGGVAVGFQCAKGFVDVFLFLTEEVESLAFVL